MTTGTHTQDVAWAKRHRKQVESEIKKLEQKKESPRCPVNKSWKMEECAQCQFNHPGHISIERYRDKLDKDLQLLKVERRQLNKVIRSAKQ